MTGSARVFWCWIWVVMAAAFAIGETITPATLFFLPFAIGAALASVLGFQGLEPQWQWLAFAATSGALFAALWPIGRRMDRGDQRGNGIGAARWLGQDAVVTEPIAGGAPGMVQLGRQAWRAECLTDDSLAVGTTVMVARVAGTRLIVVPAVPLTRTDPPNPSGHSPERF